MVFSKLIACAIVCLGGTPPAFALSCDHRYKNDTNETVAARLIVEADVIFRGRVERIEYLGAEVDGKSWLVTYRVERIFKGPQLAGAEQRLIILASFWCDGCKPERGRPAVNITEWMMMKNELVLARKHEGPVEIGKGKHRRKVNVAGQIGSCSPGRFAATEGGFFWDIGEGGWIHELLNRTPSPGK